MKTLIPSRFHIKKRYSEDQYDEDTVEIHDQQDKFGHKEYGNDEDYEHHYQYSPQSKIHLTTLSEEDLYELSYLLGAFDDE